MEILNSIEVRWFIDDVNAPAAAAATAWFAGVKLEGKREDRYLVTGREDIGFKARVEEPKPAKVETKYLLGSLGATQLSDRFVGDLERWRKLSLDLSDPQLEKDGVWIRVAKARRLRKFSYDMGVVTEVDTKAHPDAGCGVELTELDLTATGKRALTVGLEAFGPENSLLDVLLRVCERAFESAPKLRLGGELSASYPRWLTRVAGGGT